MLRFHPRLVLLAIMLILCGGLASPTTAQEATPGEEDAALYDAVLAEQRDAVLAETVGKLSVYTIDAALDPGPVIPAADSASPVASPAASPPGAEGGPPEGGVLATVTGSLDLRYVNDTGSELSEINLRLYPNDERYGEGGLALENVTVGGQVVTPELSVTDTVATLSLGQPLAHGGTTEISMQFTTTVVQPQDFFSTMLAADPTLGTISLAHWYPILAGYDQETGWVLDPVSIHGDLVFSNTALYDVTVSTPGNVALATSGTLVSETGADTVLERRYITGPAREFTAIADNDFTSIEQEVDGTTVTVWYNPEHEAGAKAILSYGTAALRFFNERFGTYPFAALDLVETSMLGAGGIEYSQLIGLDTLLFEDPEVQMEQGLPEGLTEYITVHEVAHQWWYDLVGNNHYAHAFIDEGLSEASTIVYFDEVYGAEAAERVTLLQLSINYAYLYALSGDHAVDHPTNAFPDEQTYFISVYAKGGMGFLAIREQIGEEAFADGLRLYVEQMRFGVATPEDLLTAFEEASGQDLSDLWHAWFETAGDRVVIEVELDVEPEATPDASPEAATPVASGSDSR